jgi:hypothetical protein
MSTVSASATSTSTATSTRAVSIVPAEASLNGKGSVLTHSEAFPGYPNVFLDLMMAIFGGQVWNILPSAYHPEVAATAGGTYLCGTVVGSFGIAGNLGMHRIGRHNDV